MPNDIFFPSKGAEKRNDFLRFFKGMSWRAQKTLTDESLWPLLDDLDAEGARRVTLVRVALHGDVALRLERPVHAAVVLVSKQQQQQQSDIRTASRLYVITGSACTGPLTTLPSASFDPQWNCIGST